MKKTEEAKTRNMEKIEVDGIKYALNRVTGYCFRYEKLDEKGHVKPVRIPQVVYAEAKMRYEQRQAEALEALNKEQNKKNEFTNISKEDVEMEVKKQETKKGGWHCVDVIVEEWTCDALIGRGYDKKQVAKATSLMARNPATIKEIGEKAVELHRSEFNEFVFQLAEKLLHPEPEKKKTARKPKAECITYVMTDESKVLLTMKQQQFLQQLGNAHLLANTAYIEDLPDTLEAPFKDAPMTIGAMVSTLREKGILAVSINKTNPEMRACKYIEWTKRGEELVRIMGLA